MSQEGILSVESMAYGGYGVARMGQKVFFIPYSVIGDKVRVEVTQEKKTYGFGRVSSIVDPSPWRTAPLCSSFGLCGGCHWQHIAYPHQGELKRQILEEMLKRVGGLREIPSITVFSSESPYGYRLRVRLKAEGQKLGYYQQESHELIDLNHCPVAHPLINETLATFRQEIRSFPDGTEVEIRVSPEEGKTVILLHRHAFSETDAQRLRGSLGASPLVKGLVLLSEGNAHRLGDPRVFLPVRISSPGKERTFRFRASPQGFFQIHLQQNQKLIETVLEFSELKERETFLDLYAGIGNLTLPLASQGNSGAGIEENPVAFRDALFNRRENRIAKCHFIRGRVEGVFRSGKTRRVDLVVLDPPRAGGKTVVEGIAQLRPSRIVYISCNPGTLARDLHLLLEKGYDVQRLALIDMFPQTYHMEVVTLLKERSRRGAVTQPGG